MKHKIVIQERIEDHITYPRFTVKEKLYVNGNCVCSNFNQTPMFLRNFLSALGIDDYEIQYDVSQVVMTESTSTFSEENYKTNIKYRLSMLPSDIKANHICFKEDEKWN